MLWHKSQVHDYLSRNVHSMRAKYDSFVCVVQPLIRGHIRASILNYARTACPHVWSGKGTENAWQIWLIRVCCSAFDQRTHTCIHTHLRTQLARMSDQPNVQSMCGKYDSFMCVAQPLIREHVCASILEYARSLPACPIKQMYRVCVANMIHLCMRNYIYD